MSSDDIIKQISLNGSQIETGHIIESLQHQQQLEKFRVNLLKSCQEWPDGLDKLGSPLPVLVPEQFLKDVNQLSDLLFRAVSNIVDRWWTDTEANFPERMPISARQEAVLRWMNGSEIEPINDFHTRAGVWRPDFLLSDEKHERIGQAQICEINARFCLNGFFVTAFAHQALRAEAVKFLKLKPAAEPEDIFQAYKNLIPGRTLHLLKDSEKGIDIHLFAPYMRYRYGMTVKFIRPSDLRLVQKNHSSPKFILCCAVNPYEPDSVRKSQDRFISPAGETVEEIHQVIMELHQSELEELGYDILQALAPTCINDLRSVFLVHDKRMLGIVLQELSSLVNEHKIFTAEEAEILRLGIVPTIIPNSAELRDLIRDLREKPELKDRYLLKPIGSGKGEGIIFGNDLSKLDFMNVLERLSKGSSRGPSSYVVQKLIEQARFDVIMPEENGISAVQQNPFVGTFMMINGRYLGLGIWRTSKDRICAVSSGGTWMVSFHLVADVLPPPFKAITIADVSRIAVSNITDAINSKHVTLLNEILQKDGILILDLNFNDTRSDYLFQLITTLHKHHNHGAPLTHSSTRGYFWDVKPDRASMARKDSARSETMEDFPWHTDCSYDSRPPRFFGLHVLQADRCGGGTLSVMQTSSLVEKLRVKTIRVLCEPEYRIQVPAEFSKGTKSDLNGSVDFIIGRLLAPINPPSTSKDASASMSMPTQMRFRFRSDIVQALTPRAEEALRELNRVLGEARQGGGEDCLQLTPQILPSDSIVLLDNSRWIHARNRVKDVDRHLRRLRWDATEF